jgi:hypothetical protein
MAKVTGLLLGSLTLIKEHQQAKQILELLFRGRAGEAVIGQEL